MYLIHLIHRLIDLIFPVAYKKYLLQVQNEVWPYDDKRFSGHALRLVYPNLRINKQEDKKLWIVHSLNGLTPYLFLNSVGFIASKALIRDTAKCIITKLPLVDGKCYLRLVEYKYPSHIKMRVGKNDEVLFAAIRIETWGRVYDGFKIDFYI
ncbi:hypothetical protein [Bacteroides sp.]|uniref:hypothetical protein n=1 Tax=Bacteroides sp. TaxID=29523 RepID=UPI00262BC560|nr:hypothetical protein [Bacteroides sp.]